MINRELIRIKVAQLVYAFFLNGNNDMDNAEKELLFSLSKAYDLYIHLLQLILAITDDAKIRYEVAKAKAVREEKELPSAKFIENKFVSQLRQNKQFNEYLEHKHFSWEENADAVKALFARIEKSEMYAEYMSTKENVYEEDKELWRKIYKKFIAEDEYLEELLEEKSLYWNDDKFIEDTFVLKTIRRFEESAGEEQELLPEYRDESDKDFAVKLFRNAVENADTYQSYMSDVSRNWDLSRLSYTDVILMQIAISEMLSFPDIALEVTINEYIEIAKMYSTPKSAGYINGMLDAIARNLYDEGLILKSIKKR